MLRPLDIATLLHLRLHPADTYGAMAARLGVSTSTAHGSVARLLTSRLAYTSAHAMAIMADGPAIDFLVFGAPYAFAPETVPQARGIVTGLKALPGEAIPGSALELVWPSRLGDARGIGVTPLVPAAPDLPDRDPRLYRLLALVDALRLGDARERTLAHELLRAELIG